MILEKIKENFKVVIVILTVLVACIIMLAMCSGNKPYIGEWTAHISSLSDLALNISITDDEIIVKAYEYGHAEQITFSYTVSKDDQYTYLETTYSSYSSEEKFVLVLLDKNTLAICYAEEGGQYMTRTPSGTRFDAEFMAVAHKGKYDTKIPDKINIRQLGERLDWDDFSHVDVKYYPSSSLLYLDDGYEKVVVYVKSNGDIVYVEGLALKGLAGYDYDDISTDHPFIITDDK